MATGQKPPKLILNMKYCPNPATAQLKHCFFCWIKTRDVGIRLLTVIRQHEPGVTPSGLLQLEFHEQGDKEMSLVWIASYTLPSMWTIRASGRVVDLYLYFETKVDLLRETRYVNVNAVNRI